MGQMIKNVMTREQIEKPEPLDIQIPYDGGVMISETDKKGIITYVNRKFIDMNGYTKEELIGAPHSIIRHPDMPKAFFNDMWRKLKKGYSWEGYVKNMCHDGTYYNVYLSIHPKYNDTGDIVGYISSRKIPNEKSMNEALKQYKVCLEKEKKAYNNRYHL